MEVTYVDVGSTGDTQVWLRTDQEPHQYYCRVRIPIEYRENRRNPYKRKALGTTDLDLAKELALEFASELRGRIRRGEILAARSFQSVAQEWLKDLESRIGFDTAESAFRRYRSCTQRYLIPFFGKKPIDEISSQDCNAFLVWRQRYRLDGPGKGEASIPYIRNGKALTRPVSGAAIPAASTVQKDFVALSKTFQFAQERRLINAASIPILPRIRSSSAPRPDFTRRQQAMIRLYFSQLHREKGQSGGRQKRRSWALLDWFVRIMLATGLRVQECMNLRWRHIDLDEETHTARVRIPPNLPGLKSVTHARVVVPTKIGYWLFMQVATFYLVFDDHEIEPDDFLWHHPDGSQIKSFRNGFGTMLQSTGLKESEGYTRSPTSLRHTYACNRLRKGTTTYELCKNMGTSEQMIRKHYDHVIVEEFAANLEID